MARIIYVEDESEWLDLTRSALIGHQVDCADSFHEAVALIQQGEAYDLALVDLHLGESGDRLGGEILDMLMMDYPGTRRIVVTGHPPEGGLRVNIFERYGVDEIIIKGRTTLPDLRRIVTEVLRADSPASATGGTDIGKSELLARYHDLRGHLEGIILTRMREARDGARRPGRSQKGEGGHPAQAAENRLLQLRDDFVRQCSEFERVLSEATDVPAVAAARDLLDSMMEDFTRALK